MNNLLLIAQIKDELMTAKTVYNDRLNEANSDSRLSTIKSLEAKLREAQG